jgi:Mor family transcriptional regulator
MPKGSLTARVVALIGSEATLHLFQAFGGERLYFPHPPLSPAHPIAKTLGHQAALILCQEFGGLTIVIPLGRELERRERNAAILEAYRQGTTKTALVKRFNLSLRMIYSITATDRR